MNIGLITQKELKKTISEAKKASLNIKAVISVHLTGKPVDLSLKRDMRSRKIGSNF